MSNLVVSRLIISLSLSKCSRTRLKLLVPTVHGLLVGLCSVVWAMNVQILVDFINRELNDESVVYIKRVRVISIILNHHDTVVD